MQNIDHINHYQQWVSSFFKVSQRDNEGIANHLALFKKKPKIAIILTGDTSVKSQLTPSITSIKEQIYSEWMLFIVDEKGHSFHTEEKDQRIKSLDIKNIENIEAEYFLFMEAGDTLSPHALYLMAYALEILPGSKIIYGDDDYIDDAGNYSNPIFKGGWNKELLYVQDYISSGTLFSFDLVQKFLAKSFEYADAASYYLALKSSEWLSFANAVHVPYITYHRAENNAAKSSVEKARADFFKEKFPEAEIQYDAKNLPRILWPLPKDLPKITVIVPTKDNYEMLKRCIEGLHKTDYPAFSILIVSNQSSTPEMLEYLAALKSFPKISIIFDDQDFNFSRICNKAAKMAEGDSLLFLNDDAEAMDSNWLKEMLRYAVKSDVGAVGAKLLFPNGNLQHAGVLLGATGIASHYFYNESDDAQSYMDRADLAQEVSAVTAACMMVRKEVFDKIGGFDEKNLGVTFNDVDLCLRLNAKGYRVIYTPKAKLIHHESASRGSDDSGDKLARYSREADYMRGKWNEWILNDPYYNLSLDEYKGDFSLAFPPRITKPWLEYLPQLKNPVLSLQPPVIVIGMHRSGTSLVSEILEKLGVFMGAKKDHNNESLFFLNINEIIFNENAAHWDDPAPLKSALGKKEIREHYQDTLIKIFEYGNVGSYLGEDIYRKTGGLKGFNSPWGWKDPRSTFTLPLWKAIFPKARIIHVCRHGVDVAASLLKRNENEEIARKDRCNSLEGGLSLWAEYMQEFSNYINAHPNDSLSFKYEELVLRPEKILQKIAEFCQLTLSPAKLDNIISICRKQDAYKYKNNPANNPVLYEFSLSNAKLLSKYGYE